MKFIQKVPEGCRCDAIIGWRIAHDSRLCLHLRLWRLHIYWRLRAKWLTQPPNTCRPICWDIQWESYVSRQFKIDFDTQNMQVGEFIYSIEFMLDLPHVLDLPEEYAYGELKKLIDTGVRRAKK